jgi:hypothetical protein
MNHHIFIAISTFLFYIILKQYSNKKRIKKQNKKPSNLIYVVFLPCTLYLFKYIYCNNNFVGNINTPQPSDSILSNPYPESLSTN